jgi:hypothetical protein
MTDSILEDTNYFFDYAGHFCPFNEGKHNNAVSKPYNSYMIAIKLYFSKQLVLRLMRLLQ